MSSSLGRETLYQFSSVESASAEMTQAVESQPRLSATNEALLLLGELASELSLTLDFESLQYVLSHKLRWIVDFDQCTLAVRPEAPDMEYLLLEITSPRRARSTPWQKVSLDEGWPGKVLAESKPYFLLDLTQPLSSIIPPTNPQWGIDLNAGSLTLLPLQAGGRTVGSLNLSSSRPGTYSAAARRNLASLLAAQIGGQLGSILAHRRTALALEALELSQTQLKSTIESREQRITQLEEQIRELQKLNQLKDEFLSTVSHELRAPLANIKMAIHMLKVAASAKRTEHYLQILEDECMREASLIDDLLSLQRLEAGSKPLMPEAIHIKDWLPPLMTLFHARLREHQQVLQLDIFPSLAPLISDRSSLERILVELVNNACQYTPPGGKIRVCARQHASNPTSLITKERRLNKSHNFRVGW